jgi:membrane fusion protein (multidrug efflux system)
MEAIEESENETVETEPTPVAPEKPKRSPLLKFGILGIVIVVGLIWGYRIWSFNQSHVVTDDAYVTTDVVPVSAKDPGNVVTVLVDDNQEVKAGDLLVKLDDTNLLADLHQAQANLAVAEAQAKGSKVDIAITGTTANAQQEQARGALAQSESDVNAAEAGVSKAIANVSSLRAAASVAQSQVRVAADAAESRRAAVAQAAAQVKSAQAGVANANAGVQSAQADLVAAQSAQAYADREAKRYRTLADQGAISQSVAESKETEAVHARAMVSTAQEKVASERSLVVQAQSQLAAAQSTVKQANAAVAQAQSEVQAARRSVEQANALTHESETGIQASRSAVAAAIARSQQAQGKLQETSVAPQKVSSAVTAETAAQARVKQAKAALERAQIALDHSQIKAPVAGLISRRAVQMGQQVASGQPLLAILPNRNPWIIANLKETQLDSLHAGLPVEGDVDALPGLRFHGKVDSVSGGTGSTFALLPADNATGNFTKVVQRIPVKIVLDPGQPNLDKLRAGLSTTVTITLKG